MNPSGGFLLVIHTLDDCSRAVRVQTRSSKRYRFNGVRGGLGGGEVRSHCTGGLRSASFWPPWVRVVIGRIDGGGGTGG